MAGAFQFVRVKSLSAKTTGASSTDAVIQVCAEHNLRQGHCYSRDKQSGAIDPSRSHMNVILRGCDTAAAVAQMARDLVRIGGWQKKYARENGAVAGELVFSLPANTQLDVIAYFRACIEWAERYFDAPSVSAVAHLDQQHPHAHLICLGVRGGQWRGGRFFGRRDAINDMHASFHAAVGKPHGLRRQQQSSDNTAIRHATAMREFDAIVAHPRLMNDPVVVQALVSLIAADPERLRAAREQAMAAVESPIALPEGAAPGGENPKRYPVLAHSQDDASTNTTDANSDDQDAVMELADDHDQQAALPTDPTPKSVYIEPSAGVAGQGARTNLLQISVKGDDDPALQSVTPEPIRIDVAAADPGHDADVGVELPERLVRVREDDLPADWWDLDRGDHAAPPPKPAPIKPGIVASVNAALEAISKARSAHGSQGVIQPASDITDGRQGASTAMSSAHIAFAMERAAIQLQENQR